MSDPDQKTASTAEASPRQLDSKTPHPQVQNMATIQNDDERRLAQIGYVQVCLFS
jgi:hypothetical protein